MEEVTAEQWFEKGKKFSNVGNSRKAIQSYKQAIKQDPNFYYAWVNMAAEYYALGNMKQTIDCCEHAIYLKHDDAKAWSTMAAAYWKMDEDGKALYCFKKAIENGDKQIERFFIKLRQKKDKIIYAEEEDVLELMEKKRKSAAWEEFITLSKIKKEKEIEELRMKELIGEDPHFILPKDEFIKQLSNSVLQILEELNDEMGGRVSVSEFISYFQGKFPKYTVTVDDFLGALDYLTQKKLILGVKELSNGIKVIDIKPVELTKDIDIVFDKLKQVGSLNLGELMDKTGWDIVRCSRVMKSMENLNLAKKISSFSEGTRWYIIN